MTSWKVCTSGQLGSWKTRLVYPAVRMNSSRKQWRKWQYFHGSRRIMFCSRCWFRDPGVLSECKFDTEEEKEVLMSNIKHRLTPHPVKIRAGECNGDRCLAIFFSYSNWWNECQSLASSLGLSLPQKVCERGYYTQSLEYCSTNVTLNHSFYISCLSSHTHTLVFSFILLHQTLRYLATVTKGLTRWRPPSRPGRLSQQKRCQSRLTW